MRSEPEDLAGVPVVTVEVKGLVNGPAPCSVPGNQTLIIPPANDGYDKT
jgi:hypothetical protein